MTKAEIVSWVKNEFSPLSLATPDANLIQQVENSIRYLNNHSAYKISSMYTVSTAMTRVQISSQFKTVVNVYPNKSTWILANYPLWTLTGVAVLDNITSDLILVSEAFKEYKTYMGTDFRWWFDESFDPDVGGYLYFKGIPTDVTSVFVVGTKRVSFSENVVNQAILDWLLRYVKALVKVVEGNSLRKSSIIGVKNDGQELVDEGIAERKSLEEQLTKDGRWVALARRF